MSGVFSPAERRRLAAGAATLHDRLEATETAGADAADGATDTDGPAGRSNDRGADVRESDDVYDRDAMGTFNAWADEFDADDGLLDRLALSGRRPDDCLDRLSGPAGDPDADWIRIAADLVGHLDHAEFDPHPEDGSDRPFAAVTVPLAAYGRHQVDWDDSPVTAGAVDDLVRILRNRLEELLVDPLYVRFDAYRSTNGDGEPEPDATGLYEGYVGYLHDGGLKRFFLEYPVAARLAVVTIDRWVATVAEFLGRFAADRELLGDHDIAPDARVDAVAVVGDSHAGGRTALRVDTNGGSRIAYKPRSVAPAAAFRRVVDWLADAVADVPVTPPALHAIDPVVRDGYGWMSWVSADPCPDADAVRTYFRRAGGLLALLYALRFVDGHLENLIAHGSVPTIVDLETLGHPDAMIRSGGETGTTRNDGTAVATGFLPRTVGNGMSTTAGLSLPSSVREDEHAATYDAVDTDAMTVSFGRPAELKGDSLPVLDGEPVRPTDYPDAVQEGFADTYRALLAVREGLLADDGPLAAFKGVELRFLFRTTRTYAETRRRIGRPERLADGREFGIGIETLAEPFVDGRVDDAPWALFDAERRALNRFDVPRFTLPADGTAAVHDGERIAPNAVTEPPLDRIRDRIRSLNPADLRENLDYLRLAYEPESFVFPDDSDGRDHGPGGNGRGSGGTDGRLSAEPVGRDAVAGRLRPAAAAATGRLLASRTGGEWVLRRSYTEHGFREEAARPELYEGRAGIALALAAAGTTLGVETYRELARLVVTAAVDDRPEPNEYDELGAGSGLGGDAYALAAVGELTGHDALHDRADDLLAVLSDDRIRAAEGRNGTDVLRGIAGLALGATAVYDRTGGDAALARAVTAGDRLLALADRSNGSPSWWGGEPTLTDGFVHGHVGLAYALARVGARADVGRFREAARGVVDVVPTTVDGLNSVPDRDPTGWANGLPGIGLGLAGISHELDSEYARGRAREAFAATPAAVSDHADLFRGTLGRAAAFRTGASLLSDAGTLRAEARGLVAATLDGADPDDGRYGLPWRTERWPNPSLLNGLGGVVYTLARATNTELPTLLLWA